VEDAVHVIQDPSEIIPGHVDLDKRKPPAERPLEVGLLRVTRVVIGERVHADNVITAGKQRVGQV
jgi:hypothetical protein